MRDKIGSKEGVDERTSAATGLRWGVLRKMNPLRQIETAELLINANNYSVSYASATLAGTPQTQLGVDCAETNKGYDGGSSKREWRASWQA